MEKKKDVFRIWTGFKFGIGLVLAYFFMEGALAALMALVSILMKGLGYFPGV